jgi:anti-sigma factor RsiW
MNCRENEYMMPLYLSGELDSATMARFECHAAECPLCRREMEDLQAMDRAVCQALLTEHIDATPLQARVMKQIHSERPQPPFWQAFRIALAAAALLFCAVLVGSVYHAKALYKRAQLDHVNEVVMGHEQRWLTDETAIQKMMEQRLSTPVQLQRLTIPGYRLLRARRCLLGTHHYIHLVYGDGTEEMSMYILVGQDTDVLSRVSALLSPSIYSRAESGYNVTEGDAKGRRILLVGTTAANKQQAIISDRLSVIS